MSKPIYILNGPNLNRLGAREPEIYGAGSAFVTLPQKERDRFWTRAEALKVKRSMVKLAAGGRKAIFVKPELRVIEAHAR